MRASVKVALATLLCSYAFISCTGGGEVSVRPTCIGNYDCDYSGGYVCYQGECVKKDSVNPDLLDPCMSCTKEQECLKNQCLNPCPDNHYRNNDTFECIEYDCHDYKPCPQDWEKCSKDHICIDERDCNNDGRNCPDGHICDSTWKCYDNRECHEGKSCTEPLKCDLLNYKCVAECVTKDQCPGEWDRCVEGKCTDVRDCTDTGKNCDPGYTCNTSTWKCDDRRECTFDPIDSRKCTDGLECNPADFTCTIDHRDCVPSLGRNCRSGFECENYHCIDKRQCDDSDSSVAECPNTWESCYNYQCVDTRKCKNNSECPSGFTCDENNTWECLDQRECYDGPNPKECVSPYHCVDYKCKPECVTKSDCSEYWESCVEGKCTDARVCNDTGKNCDPGYTCNTSTWKCDDRRECTFDPGDPRSNCPDGLECNPADFTCTIDHRDCVPSLGRNCRSGFECENYHCIDKRQCDDTDSSVAECPNTWESCRNYKCVDMRQCKSDNDCADGFVCDKTQIYWSCKDMRQCHASKPCGDGYQCINYECIEKQCTSECPEGQKCALGECAEIWPHTTCMPSCGDSNYQCIGGQCILKVATPFTITVNVTRAGIVQFDDYFEYQGGKFPSEYYANEGTYIDCGGGMSNHNYTYAYKGAHKGLSCEYTKAGMYTIKLYGQVDHLALCQGKASGDPANTNYSIVSVDKWGDSRWKSLESMFKNCDDLEIKDVSAPDIRQVSNAETMFRLSNDVRIPAALFDRADRSLSFKSMFMSARNISAGVSQWDTHRVTNMSQMFYASDFRGDLTNWDVSNVTDMTYMFHSASNFDGCGKFSNWNLQNLKYADYMFENSGLEFDCTPTSWCLKRLESYTNMFGGLISCSQINRSCLQSNVNVSMMGCW